MRNNLYSKIISMPIKNSFRCYATSRVVDRLDHKIIIKPPKIQFLLEFNVAGRVGELLQYNSKKNNNFSDKVLSITI